MKHNVLTAFWQRYPTSRPKYNQNLTFLQRRVPAGDEVLTKIQSSRVCYFTKIVSFRVFARDLKITSKAVHCFKSIHIQRFSGPYLPTFGLNTERYGVSLHIQSEFGKMRTRKTPNTDTFQALKILCYISMDNSVSAFLVTEVRGLL